MGQLNPEIAYFIKVLTPYQWPSFTNGKSSSLLDEANRKWPEEKLEKYNDRIHCILISFVMQNFSWWFKSRHRSKLWYSKEKAGRTYIVRSNHISQRVNQNLAPFHTVF